MTHNRNSVANKLEEKIKRFEQALAKEGKTPDTIKQFKKLIRGYYEIAGRTFAWREIHNPYHIVVSEIMLQQTQTDRVAKKYEEFIRAFPNFKTLAEASLTDILRVWCGMGYNRRAIALKKIAEKVVGEFGGRLPADPAILATFPGIGKATAASIVAFAFNKPVLFIETNIRSVFIHFFFGDRDNVKDSEILPLVEETLDRKNPREWYYALMDFGVMLKKSMSNPSRRSKHYRKQSTFEGSNRQIRGMILDTLVSHPASTEKKILSLLGKDPEKVKYNLKKLGAEGFIEESNGTYSIKK